MGKDTCLCGMEGKKQNKTEGAKRRLEREARFICGVYSGQVLRVKDREVPCDYKALVVLSFECGKKFTQVLFLSELSKSSLTSQHTHTPNSYQPHPRKAMLPVAAALHAWRGSSGDQILQRHLDGPFSHGNRQEFQIKIFFLWAETT